MSTIRIQFDLDGLAQAAQDIRNRAIIAIDEAVGQIAIQTGKRWAMAIMASPLPEKTREEYAKTLKLNRLGMAHYEIVADYQDAERIEDGRPARDLKKYLTTSNRTRVSKDGKKYLIIPFRHNTPGNSAHAPAMPPSIYAKAKHLSTSSVTGQSTRQSATGHTVPQSVYKWGGRLPAGLAPKAQPHHATDIYAGMVRMKADGGSKKKSSAYLTFRVMHQDSAGWIVPAKPGLKIAEGVAEYMQSHAETYIQAVINNHLA